MIFDYRKNPVYEVMNDRRTAANVIEMNTIEACMIGECKHSWQEIIEQNRKPALACRMTNKNISFNDKVYDAAGIINIFIDSCKKYGYTFYPIKYTNEVFKGKVKQLRLFQKENGKYYCKACFEVEDVIEDADIMHMSKYWTDKEFILSELEGNCFFKISSVQTIDLPEDYIALRTGKSIYEVAFYGRNPNIWII